jgi:iron complex transport system substrate-binding protein
MPGQGQDGSQSADVNSARETPPKSVTDAVKTEKELEPDRSEEEPRLPVTVTDGTGEVVTVESIERIIPLDGDIAEVVFALDLGDRVVATDLSATFPPEADDLPQIGYQRALSAEPIAAFEPTVLLATALAGPPEALDELRRLGLPLIIVPSEPTSRGVGLKIRAVATALGVSTKGEALAAEVERSIAIAAAEWNCRQTCPRVLMIYVRGTAAQLVFGESSPTRWLIEAAGGVDVSRELDVVDPTPISAEAIIAASPDVLITTTVGLDSVGGVEGLLQIPGLAATPAGQKRQILAYDAQLLLGNGPRVPDLLSRLTNDLKAISEIGKE